MDIAAALALLPQAVGTVGGLVGAASGVAVFARRRLRIKVAVTRNSGPELDWHTVSIANRSDVAVSFRDFALAWFIATPLGRHRLNWAHSPEEETPLQRIGPGQVLTFTIEDEHWDLPQPRSRRRSAYLRAHIDLPSRAGGVWLPVAFRRWTEDGWRRRALNRLYGVNRSSEDWT